MIFLSKVFNPSHWWSFIDWYINFKIFSFDVTRFNNDTIFLDKFFTNWKLLIGLLRLWTFTDCIFEGYLLHLGLNLDDGFLKYSVCILGKEVYYTNGWSYLDWERNLGYFYVVLIGTRLAAGLIHYHEEVFFLIRYFL